MKLKANDTVHVSSAGPDNLQAGDVFEVSDEQGKQLIERGLATEIKGAKSDEKAEPAPKNKADPAPKNKGIISTLSKED